MTLPPLVRRLELHLWVGVGSVLGGLARLLVGLVLPGLPGTLFANLSGSLAIGLFAALTGPDGRLLVSTRERQLVASGICGGYTTFSLLSLESVELLRAGAATAGLLYASLSLLGALLAVWAGYALGERLNRPRRGRR